MQNIAQNSGRESDFNIGPFWFAAVLISNLVGASNSFDLYHHDM